VGFAGAVEAGIERFNNDKKTSHIKGKGCLGLTAEEECHAGTNQCFWNDKKCEPIDDPKEYFTNPLTIEEQTPEDVSLGEEVQVDEEGNQIENMKVEVDEEANPGVYEGFKDEVEVDEEVAVDEEGAIEQFDNFNENFYSSMNQWRSDGVKPAHNLSGNSNKLHAPVNY